MMKTKMIKMKSMTAIVAAAILSHSAFAVGSALDDLKPEDQAKIKNGAQVTMTAPGKNSAWPQIWVYQRVEATPEEVMAVFHDYELQVNYMPNLTYSKISKIIDKATVEVGFAVATHVIFHPHESYTMREHVSTYDGGASYRMDWQLVSAQQIRDIVGHAQVEALGSGSLVAYYSFVTPPSIAGGQSGRAIAGVQGTVTGLIGRVLKLRTDNQSLLQTEIGSLRDSLAP